MPFIEDENGLAIYFTREEWVIILDELMESLEIYSARNANSLLNTNTPFDAMLEDIVSRIKKHIP